MKAEHRKELQTNTLADNLGRMIQGGRHLSRRTLLIILLAVVAGGIFLIWRNIQAGNANTRSSLFLSLDQGNRQTMEEIAREGISSEPAKAAFFQIAWVHLWDSGIKALPSYPYEARRNLEAARQLYVGLAKECANEPSLAAEALYAQALIEETLMGTELQFATGKQQLDRAVELYRRTASEFQETAHGKLAAKRAEYLEKNREQVEQFYQQIASRIAFRIDFESKIRDLQKQKEK